MATSSHSQTPEWRRQLGLTAGNPFAPFIFILTLIVFIVLVITLVLSFVGQTVNTRFAAAITFMFVGGLSPVPIGLLIMYARNYVRIQDMLAGDYWAHWQYPSGGEYSEVYIGPQGVYYPNKKRIGFSTFLSGVQKAQIESGNPPSLRLNYLHRRYYSAVMPPINSNKMMFVPIPEGKEDEAQGLVQKFNKQLGQPSNFVNDQWLIGWIMGAVIIGFVLISILLLWPMQSQLDEQKFAARDATATMYQATEVAQVSVLLKPIRAVMDPQIERLQSLPDGKISAAEAGFDSSAGVSAIYYGHCPPDNAFYIYVVMTREVLGRSYLGGPGAFNYTTATDRRYMDCGPEHLISTVPDKLDNGWYYAVIARIESTRVPRRIDTPEPTATGSPSS